MRRNFTSIALRSTLCRLSVVSRSAAPHLSEKQLGEGQDRYKPSLLGRCRDFSAAGIAVDVLPALSFPKNFHTFTAPLLLPVNRVFAKIHAAYSATAASVMRTEGCFSCRHLFKKRGAERKRGCSAQNSVEHLQSRLVSTDGDFLAPLLYAQFDLQKYTITSVDCAFSTLLHYRETKATAELEEKSIPIKERFGSTRLKAITKNSAESLPYTFKNLIKNAALLPTQKTFFDLHAVLLTVQIGGLFYQNHLAKFSSDLSQIRAVRTFIRTLCLQAPGDCERLSQELELAVNEAFCNIAIHGKGRAEVHLLGSLHSKGVTIELRDQGGIFDPTTVCDPSFAGDRDHGFGWYIVKEIADRVDYEKKESELNWNRLKIFKKYYLDGEKWKFLTM